MIWNCVRTLFIALFACAVAAPVAGQETTPAMVAAAAKEGKVVWYSSIDVKVAELIAKAFRAEYPNIQIEVERSGSERVFQRINQEYQSGIKNVDVVNSSDASHFLYWKQQKLLAPHVPPDVQRYPAQFKDPEGYYAAWRATLSVMGYNTNLVPAKDAPTGYLDLLDPKWKGKLVKSHPGYSGTSLTGTYAIVKAAWLGLSREAVQARGAAAAVDDRDAEEHRQRRTGGHGRRQRVQHVHRDRCQESGGDHLPEGRHAVRDVADGDLCRCAASQRRARSPKFSLYRQDPAAGGERRRHAFASSRCQGSPGRTPLAQIKILPDDPAAMLPQVADIKKRYTALFGN